MTSAQILQQISEWQGIHKHPLWQKASVILHELYAEMAKRNVPAGTHHQ